MGHMTYWNFPPLLALPLSTCTIVHRVFLKFFFFTVLFNNSSYIYKISREIWKTRIRVSGSQPLVNERREFASSTPKALVAKPKHLTEPTSIITRNCDAHCENKFSNNKNVIYITEIIHILSKCFSRTWSSISFICYKYLVNYNFINVRIIFMDNKEEWS